MKEFAQAEWERARQALAGARQIHETDPEGAASRAYYAAFHAITALFALRGETFSKHSALRAALHRDLINTDVWPVSLGQHFDFLMELRELADYGGLNRLVADDAERAIEKADAILTRVRSTCAELFD